MNLYTTNSAAKRNAYVLGTVTLSSIKNFTVAGDHATASLGYFEAVGTGGANNDGMIGA